MSPGKNGLRKSTRITWKEGDTRALFRAPGRRAPEEIATAKEKAAEERKSKEQAIEAKEKKTARDVQVASQLEDALVEHGMEAEKAFPRCRGDVETEDDSKPDKEGPAQEASEQTAAPSKQTSARRQAQPNRRQFAVEIKTPARPVRGSTSPQRKPLKRSYAVMDLSTESAETRRRSKKKHNTGAASEEADKPAGDKDIEMEGGADIPRVVSKPKPRAVLKRKDAGEQLEDNPFDLRHRKRVSQSVSRLDEPGQNEEEDTRSEEGELTPRPKRTTPKAQVTNDGISELASTDDPEWGMNLGDDDDEDEDEDDERNSTDLTMEEDDPPDADDHCDSDSEEGPPKQKGKAKKKANKKANKKVDLKAAISQGRLRKQPEVEPYQPTINNRDLRHAKATSGVSEAWLKQNKTTIAVQRQRRTTGSDDDSTASETNSNAPSKPSRKRTTRSSVAVVAHAQVLSSKRARNAPTSSNSEKVRDKELMDVQTTPRYGGLDGLEDEDDTEEWEAIKQSPMKGRGVRISDHAIVKVESPVKLRLPARMSEWTTDHLPVGAVGKWRKVFITSFAAYIGTKRTPWELKDKESLEAMQGCWDHVYGSTLVTKHRISGIHDVVFVLGDQRWKELRNIVASAALQALEEYYKSIGANTNLQRRDEAVKISAKNSWMYGTVERNANGKLTRLEQPFYNPLVLKPFATFLKWTKLRDETWPMIAGKSPVGALGLATAAVERAVGFWANLSVSAETANQSAVKPFNKRKGKTVKSEPDSQTLNDPPEEANVSADTRKKEEDRFGRIEEFNADMWSLATKDWITGALDKGFDSMAIMQPLIDTATQVSVSSSSNRSRPDASTSAIGPSSSSRCKIVEGVLSDSE